MLLFTVSMNECGEMWEEAVLTSKVGDSHMNNGAALGEISPYSMLFCTELSGAVTSGL